MSASAVAVPGKAAEAARGAAATAGVRCDGCCCVFFVGDLRGEGAAAEVADDEAERDEGALPASCLIV